jgi:hypothetical protein
MLPKFFRLIGSDRYLAAEEVARATGPHALIGAAWDVYASEFGRFTGATLDPRFHRLAHPATQTGRIRLDADTTVLVAGTGPSLLTAMHGVKRVRGHVRIFTSPEGAAMLAGYGVRADLVLVDPASSISAKGGSLVAADWRTPRELLTGVSTESLFVPAASPTWGVWPATAVAMAVDAGASRVAIVGLDESSTANQKRGEERVALLELIARLGTFTAFDCGGAVAPARGWVAASVHEVGGNAVSGRMDMKLWRAAGRDERALLLREELAELSGILDRARELSASTALADAAVAEVIAWREQPRLRVLLQESLGVSLLPRLWRLGADQSTGRSRRVRLALSEIVAQADAFAAAA